MSRKNWIAKTLLLRLDNVLKDSRIGDVLNGGHVKAGRGKGNWGHKGRPGLIGGSSPRGGRGGQLPLFELPPPVQKPRPALSTEEKLKRKSAREWKNLSKAYPLAGDSVDGREIINRGNVPNTASISATFSDYEVLPGIRKVSTKGWDNKGMYSAADDLRKSRKLQDAIKESGEITPLIVGVNESGPWIIEGNHRFHALVELGAKSFPAVVVKDLD